MRCGEVDTGLRARLFVLTRMFLRTLICTFLFRADLSSCQGLMRANRPKRCTFWSEAASRLSRHRISLKRLGCECGSSQDGLPCEVQTRRVPRDARKSSASDGCS